MSNRSFVESMTRAQKLVYALFETADKAPVAPSVPSLGARMVHVMLIASIYSPLRRDGPCTWRPPDGYCSEITSSDRDERFEGCIWCI